MAKGGQTNGGGNPMGANPVTSSNPVAGTGSGGININPGFTPQPLGIGGTWTPPGQMNIMPGGQMQTGGASPFPTPGSPASKGPAPMDVARTLMGGGGQPSAAGGAQTAPAAAGIDAASAMMSALNGTPAAPTGGAAAAAAAQAKIAQLLKMLG